MNCFERIQRSIDFIEKNLPEEITVESCAREAFMSVSGYYSAFLSVAGYSVKEYIRLRRLTEAYEGLAVNNVSITETAAKYAYNSTDSFSRAFKNRFGVVPSKAKNDPSSLERLRFRRLDVLESLLENDPGLSGKYPDIKVIRSLQPMKCACFTYYGENPEDHAFSEIRK